MNVVTYACVACIEKDHRIRELEAQLKDRHKRLNKMQQRCADLIEAVEDMDHFKAMKTRAEAAESKLRAVGELPTYTNLGDLDVMLSAGMQFICADELEAVSLWLRATREEIEVSLPIANLRGGRKGGVCFVMRYLKSDAAGLDVYLSSPALASVPSATTRS